MSHKSQSLPHRIGIVDDDDDVRASLGALIESLGHEVEAFDSADSLIASEHAGTFSCIITDLQMPGTNGIQLAKTMQNGGPPVILITAFPSPTVERQAREVGASYFLRKPFKPGEFIAVLTDILA